MRGDADVILGAFYRAEGRGLTPAELFEAYPHVSRPRLIRAAAELQERGLIEPASEESFRITHKGYAFWENTA